jgi:GT2 family glycosyltransferase
MDLSICIVNYNTKDILKKCLRSIIFNIKGLKTQIIVVDNGSSDKSTEMVEKYFPKITLIKNKYNLFFSKANNQAINISKGKFILIMNSDIIIKNNSLKKLIDYMKSSSNVAALTCKLVNFDNNMLENVRKYHTVLSMIFKCEIMEKIFKNNKWIQNNLRINKWDLKSINKIDVAEDSFLLIRQKTLKKIGYYDEKLSLYYTEDDLCLRIKNEGMSVYYYPFVKIYHGVHQTAKQLGNIPIMKIRVKDQYIYCKKYFKIYEVILIMSIAIIDLIILMIIESFRIK